MGWFTKSPIERAETALAKLDDEQRANLFASSSRVPSWGEFSGGFTQSSINVTLSNALGIPAFAAAITLITDTIAMLPLNVYRGRGADKRLADNTWQYRLLAEIPGMGDFTPVDLLSDIVASLEWEGNAFLLKVRAGTPPEVVALIMIDPTRVRIERKNGEKLFLIRDDNGHEETYTAAQILHVRGWTPNGTDRGMSVVSMHKEKLGSIIAQDMFQGRFFSSGLLKNFAIQYPGKLDEQQAERLYEVIRNQTGLRNSFLPFVVQNGGQVIPTGMSLAESQFVEGERQSMIQVAHMFRIPPAFLVPNQSGASQTFEQDNLRFYNLCVAPRLRRIEMAFFTDADMFPQRQIYPEFDVAPLLRTDAATRAEVEHKQVQAGIRTRDEIRADNGWAPLPDGAGKVIPETPTGAGQKAGSTEPKPKEDVPVDVGTG